MLRAYKYRIYPNGQQKKLIDHTFGCCRLVYNLALEVKITAYKEAGIKLSAFDLIYQLFDMKKDYYWLRQVDSQALRYSIQHMDASFRNFFRGWGYPKFKKKTGRQSFQCSDSTRRVDFEKGTITIAKIRNIKAAIDRTFEGKIKQLPAKAGRFSND